MNAAESAPTKANRICLRQLIPGASKAEILLEVAVMLGLPLRAAHRTARWV